MSVPMLFAAEPTISLTATPRYPWSGLVDLAFTIEGDDGAKYDTSFSVQDVIGGTNLAMKTVYKSPGVKANTGLEKLVPGTYNWIWDAPADVGNDFVSESVVIDAKVGDAITYSVKFNANGGSGSMAIETFESGVAKALSVNKFARAGYVFQGWATSSSGAKVYSDKQSVTDLTTTAGGVVNLYAVWKLGGVYMVIDLSGGSSATSYPISYLDSAPSGGWGDVYRTSKMVLRKVSTASFYMGSTTSELGRGTDEYRHQVTLSQPYYIGIFEVTQKQYQNIMGSNPSGQKGDMRPVEKVSYNLIRGSSLGAKWPSSREVDLSSVMGKMRARTGIMFDLPSEAQWECASRAGKTTALYSGKNLSDATKCPNVAALARYKFNHAGVSGGVADGKGGYNTYHTKVGCYTANAWQIYDMYGNVYEWCGDWYKENLGTSAVTNPKGPTSGSARVVRGGGWYSPAWKCRSAWRNQTLTPGSSRDDVGFRMCVTVE